MGTASTPRHRADVPRGPRWAEIRRVTARLLAGSDLYADDRLLRAESAADAGSTDHELGDEAWAAVEPAPRTARA